MDIKEHARRSSDVREAADYCRRLGELLDKTTAGLVLSGAHGKADSDVAAWLTHIGRKLGFSVIKEAS